MIEGRILLRPSYKYQVVELEVKFTAENNEELAKKIDSAKEMLMEKSLSILEELESQVKGIGTDKTIPSEDVVVEDLSDEPTSDEYDKYIDESEAL